MSDYERPSNEPLGPEPDQALPAPAGGGPMSSPIPFWAPPAPPAPAAPPPGSSLWHRVAAAAVLAAVIAAAGGAGIGWTLARAISSHPTQTAQTVTPSNSQPQANPESPLQPVSPTTGGALSADAIAARLDPAIVDVNTIIGGGQAAGTGQIISSSGEILTNNHVVDGSTSIQVNIFGHFQSYAAHVIATDPRQDIALIQVEGVSGLPTVTFGSSSSIQVGDSIVALGNALGQGGPPAVSQGSITALDQTITASEGGSKSEQLSGMVESDATIYPGDSGGPLVNSSGQVVAMITAGEAQGFRSSASHVNYAIPSDTILRIVNQIRMGQASSSLIYGQVGYLGVTVETVDAAGAAQLGINVSSGALVRGVQAGSPAEAAGIMQNSVITSVAGSKITSIDDLGSTLQAHRPGERVSVTWVSESGSHTATLTLGAVNR